MTALALRTESTAALARARALSALLDGVLDVSFPESIEAETKAGALLREVETVRRAVEKERELEKRPHLDAGRAVDAAFKAATEPLDRLVATIRARLSEAATKRETARRLAVEEASRAALAGDAQTANAAIALANDPVFAPVVAEGVVEKVGWEIESVDVIACPREYLVPDYAKIREVARAAPVGVEPKLPGVVFKRVVTHVVRSVGR